MKTNGPKLKQQAVIPLKPREEIDFTEYYDKLDVDEQFQVRVLRKTENDKRPKGDQQSKQKGAEKRVTSDDSLGGLYNDVALVEYRRDKKLRDKAILDRLKHPVFKRIHLDGKLSHHLAGEMTLSTTSNSSSVPIMNRKYHKYGYNDSSSTKAVQRTTSAYKRATGSDYGLITGKLRKNDRLKVLYDMDNQDSLYVDYVNEQRAKKGWKEINNEFFELVLTFIEMQFFFIEQLLPQSASNEEAFGKKLAIKCSMYGSDDGIGVSPEEDQCCAICNRNDCDASNAIVFCDGCNIAVHQECYGIPFIPEGPWLCRRCLISRDHTQRCIFCPSTTGAFKQTDDGHWAHNICTLWINEVYFANPTYMEPIEGIENIPKGRWKLTCFICRKRVGACIQCSKHNCFVAYHATCAKRAGLYMKMKEGIKGALDHPLSLVSYCDKHTPSDWAGSHDMALGIEKTRLFYSRSNSAKLNKQAEFESYVPVSSEKYQELVDTKSRLFKWRTNRGAPIVPDVVVEKIITFLKKEKLLPDGFKLLLNNICKYWTLKREQSKIPLIRRPDPINYSSMSLDEVRERFGVLDVIKKDAEKLDDISEKVSKRSMLMSRLNLALTEEVEAFYFPRIFALDTVGSAFLRSDKYGVLDSISTDGTDVIDGRQLKQNIQNNRYGNVQELIDDIEQLTRCVLSKYQRNSGPYKLLKFYWGKMKRQKYTLAQDFETLYQENGMDELYNCFEKSGLSIQEIQNRGNDKKRARNHDDNDDDDNDDQGSKHRNKCEKKPETISRRLR